jgi:phosphoribosylformylglycinamidine synthase subunit PurQ / glutaminase
VHLKVNAAGPFTPNTGEVWRLPIAHAEGRYQASPEVMKALEGEGRIGLVYATAEGRVTEDANPTGSQRSIAGIYGGHRKNVFGLMPHPERMSEPALGGADGRRLFDAVLSQV